MADAVPEPVRSASSTSIRNVSPQCLEYLRACYAEPHRKYHTWDHVEELLSLSASHDRDNVLRTAALFHDAIYDIGADDNEERSAALLTYMLEQSPARDRAVECIMLCKRPFEPSESIAAIFTDIDHAILAAPRIHYVQYASAIMAEYVTKYPVEKVQTGRAAFLQGLLDRRRIFRTAWFNHMLGHAALANIGAELAFLRRASDRTDSATTTAASDSASQPPISGPESAAQRPGRSEDDGTRADTDGAQGSNRAMRCVP